MSSLNLNRACSTNRTVGPGAPDSSGSENSYWLITGRIRWRSRKRSCVWMSVAVEDSSMAPRLARQEPLAGGRVTAAIAGQQRVPALLGRAVVLGVAHVEVADGERRVRGLLEVARLEMTLGVDGVGPRPGEAVGLQLERLRARRHAVVEGAQLLLQVVGVLVSHDVRDGEVARGAAEARPLARQPV